MICINCGVLKSIEGNTMIRIGIIKLKNYKKFKKIDNAYEDLVNDFLCWKCTEEKFGKKFIEKFHELTDLIISEKIRENWK
jgi:hypothetical protein